MYSEIIKHLDLGLDKFEVTSQFHHLIWLGDLNYRINGTTEEVMEMINNKEWEKLLERDQLLITQVGVPLLFS
jgi:hypothetical protein